MSRRAARDRAGRGHRPDRRRRPPLHRRRLLALVQRPRPPPPGDRRGDPRPARPRRALDDARPHPPGRRASSPRAWSSSRRPGLSRVFYSESGSTAVEIALKMAFQYWQPARGRRAIERTSFVCLARRLPRRHDRRRSPSAASTLFHGAFGPLLFKTHRVAPGDARELERLLDLHDGEIAAVIVEPLVQGAAGIRVQPARLPAPRARALRPPRRVPDRRRGRDRLRAHGHDVRLRAGARRARLPLPRQGPHRRLPAAGRDARDRAGLRGLPRRARGGPDLLPRPHLHRQPARLRGGASPASTCSSASGRWCGCSRRSACSRELLARGRGDARGRRGARPRLHGRHRPRRARPGAARSATGSRSRRASAARSSARSATRSC